MGCIQSKVNCGFTFFTSEGKDKRNESYSLLETMSSLSDTTIVSDHSTITDTEIGEKDQSKTEQIFAAVRERDRVKLRELILEPVTDSQTTYIGCVSDSNGGFNGVNPVELACLLGYTEEVLLFLDNGCSPNLPTSIGRLIHTVLECMKSQSITVMDGYKLIVFMCEKGCDLHMKGRRRKSTLLYATELGDPLVLKLLLDNYGSYGIDDKDPLCGFTPLHMTALKGDLECLKLLLRYGPMSQVNICDNRGRSALVLALHNMLHDLKYLNNACESTESTSETITLINREKLILHQYNAIAVLESLLVAGADPNIGDTLSPAFSLVELDETKTLKSLTSDGSLFLTSLSQHCQNVKHKINYKLQSDGGNEWVSPYTGVIRLLLYSGAKPRESQIFIWMRMFRTNPSLLDLVSEISDFWKSYERGKPAALMHLCKLTIRTELVKYRMLHRIDDLPIPATISNYIKLQFL